MKWAASILVFCVAVLIGLGMVMLYSSSMNMEMNRSSVGAHYLLSQLTWCFFGVICCAAVAAMDYRHLKKASPWLLGISVILLLLVFTRPLGIAAGGAHRWIGRPGLPHLQPSEFAKLSLILFLAAYGDRFQRQMAGFKKGLAVPGVVIGIVLLLIYIEPDRGGVILLASVCGVMLVVAGVRWRCLIPPAIALVCAIAFSLARDPLRMKRIMAWRHPELNREGAGYQVWQAMIALGSGGWTGLGLGNGRQKLGFVPEHHTDFIFSIIGEELGLVATLSVVLLFIVLILCGTRIAGRSSDTFGLLLATGLTCLIGLQAIINVGVVTGVLPNKGMPLPFISYGGSNLLLMLICVGLLLSVSRFAREAVPRKSSNPFDAVLEPSHA